MSCLKFDALLQHIRKYLQELLCLISELWSSFSFPVTSRPSLGYPVSMFFLGTNHLHVKFVMLIIFFCISMESIVFIHIENSLTRFCT
jgi:hypothetical protein